MTDTTKPSNTTTGLRFLGSIGEWCEATRYWSLPASGLPVALTCMVLVKIENQSVSALNFLLCVFGVIALHCGANLLNTYSDFKSGCDRKDSADDRTLVDNLLQPSQILAFAQGFFAFGTLCGFYFLVIRGVAVLIVFLLGVGLAVGYSYAPVALKYKGWGDVVIFLCFGPLLVAGASIAMVGSVYLSVVLFSISPALITNGILHANNARDMRADKAVGATTLALTLGLEKSFQLHIALMGVPFAWSILLALAYSYSLVIVLVAFPIAIDLVKDFQDHLLKRRDEAACMRLLPQKVAQFGLWFGLLVMGGLLSYKALARSLLALLFCLGGSNNFYTFPVQARLVHNRINYLASVFTPTVAAPVPRRVTDGMLLFASLVQIITAMGFIAGIAAVECAWVMLLFIIAITPVVHHFWSYDPHPAHPKNSDSLKGDGHLSNEYVRTFPNTFDGEFVQFWKNVCVAGGLAVFLAYQEG